jgi:FdrA protein
VNVGLESFARELAAGGVQVVHVEWSPPAGGDPALADLLSKLGA